MIRRIAPLTLTALLAATSIACEKPGATERQKEEQANQQLAQARNEATQRTESAQAAATKDINVARADFEKSREDYRHARMVDLSDLDKKVADLEGKSQKASGKAKADLQDKLSLIHRDRDGFVRDMQALDKTTPAAWDDAKVNLDREWNALKATVDKAQ
jgi:hypothetical protein